MEEKSKFGIYVDKKIDEKDMKVSDFIKESIISKRKYYQLVKDDSNLEIGEIERAAKIFNMSYTDFQIALGRISLLDLTYPMTNELANNIINANKIYFENFGLDINRLTNEQKKDLAIRLYLEIETLSSHFSTK